MQTTGLPTIAALGALGGLRSSAAPLLASKALAKRRGRPTNLGARLLTARLAPRLTRAFAATEVLLDQNPKAPNRTAPSNLLPRVISAALAGAALGTRRRGSFAIPALVGGAAALVAAYASLPLRRALSRRLPRVAAGFVEDLAVLWTGAALLPLLT